MPSGIFLIKSYGGDDEMAPRYFHYENSVLDDFMKENHIETIGMSSQECRIITSAINAASRGVLDIQVEPTRLEYVISVNGKFSPSLYRFMYLCGDIHIAINLLFRMGAAVFANALNFVE